MISEYPLVRLGSYQRELLICFMGHLYNLHNQPLPKFRGAGGSSWNILMGDREGGSSIHLLVPEIDAGPIFASVEICFPAFVKLSRRLRRLFD